MKNSGSIQESTSSTGISVLIVLALGFLMATLDVTVVNVAMADMKNTLSMSLSGVTWVVDGYILTFASLLLAGGALADRFGSKTIYILGLAVFCYGLLSMRCIYKWADADCRTSHTGNWGSFVYAKLTQPFGCLLP